MKRTLRVLSLPLLLAACGSDLDLGQGIDAKPADRTITPPPAKTVDPSFKSPPPVKTFAEQALEAGARWSWVDPEPSGEPMYVSAGSSTSDLWYAGAAGTVLHWTGTAWTVRETNHDVALDIAWSPKAAEVWTAGVDSSGKGRLFRVTAGAATEDVGLSGFSVQALTGLDASHAWAVGPRGEVRAWNGSAWSTIRAASTSHSWLRSLHAVSATNLWAVGDHGEMVRFDGATWSTPTHDGTGDNPFDSDLRYEGVWGSSASDVWAAATHGTAAENGQYLPVFSHFDGTRWTVVAKPTDVCGSETPYRAATAGWWESLVNYYPAPESARYDLRRPSGSALVGTDAGNVVFQGYNLCPWRFDGAQWSPEPPAWGRVDGTLLATGVGRSQRSSATALAPRTIVVDGVRLDLTAPSAASEGASPRWRAMRPIVAPRTNLLHDASGVLWSTTNGGVAQWTPAGWSALSFSSTSFAMPATARQLVARSGADVWVGDGLDRSGGTLARGVVHWDGSTWSFIPLHRGAETVSGNSARTWALSRSIVAGAERRLYRLGNHAVEQETEIEAVLEAAPHISGKGDLLADATNDGRVYFALALAKLGGVTGYGPVSCAVGSWDGASNPRREITIEGCSTMLGGLIAQVETRLFRLADGAISVMVGESLHTFVPGVATATKRLTATRKGNVLTLRTVSTSATLSNASDGPRGVMPAGGSRANGMQDIVSAGGSRYWILAGGGLFLWDAKTDEIALARHASELQSLSVDERGDAWAVGPGLLHFTPPSTGPATTK